MQNNSINVEVKITETEEFKDTMFAFIAMLEDSRIDRKIRIQYLEMARYIKENIYVDLNRQ